MFDDLIREMDADIYDAFGRSVVLIKPDESLVVFTGVIDHEVESFTPDGQYQGTETHLTADQAVGVQPKSNIADGNKRYRVLKKLESDGFMTRWQLVPINDFDYEVLEGVTAALDQIINEEG